RDQRTMQPERSGLPHRVRRAEVRPVHTAPGGPEPRARLVAYMVDPGWACSVRPAKRLAERTPTRAPGMGETCPGGNCGQERDRGAASRGDGRRRWWLP